MSIIQSKISTAAQDFRDNAARMEELTLQIGDIAGTIAQGGPEHARERHVG